MIRVTDLKYPLLFTAIAVVLSGCFDPKLGEERAKEKSAVTTLTMMQECLDKNLPIMTTDGEVNRLYKQCWNHSILPRRT